MKKGQTKKVPLWKTLILIASVIFIIVVAAFAWFITAKYGNVGELALNVGRSTYIQIGNGDSWSNDLAMPEGTYNGFREISGNGSTLFKPVTIDDFVDGEYTRGIKKFEQINDNSEGYYYQQDLTFRSDITQPVYLDPTSYITALGDSAIDGAVRVAFFEVDGENETLSFVWAPNSTHGGSVEEYYFYQKSTTFVDLGDINLDEPISNNIKNHIAIIPTGKQPCGYNKTNRFLWTNRSWDEEKGTWGDVQVFPENAPAVFVFTENDEKDTDDTGATFYKKTIRVRVWIEGYDRECVSTIIGQKFNIKLQFSISVDEENNNE